MSDSRPDPERLLAAARVNTPGRGRLKLFLGYAPGVGKTFTMLEAAQARQRTGTDVMVGVAVTHGRPETAAMLDGLPRLALRERDHRGVRVGEFDLDGALARCPALLVVDELAHDNVAGSRHAKRWQDVEDLLAAGIDVFTTLNVQHVESLHDVVQRLTGVDVRERVPDEVLDHAAEIELVDYPPAELLERLRAGKVYLGDGASERALAGFFREPTLVGLRELALRLVADRVGSARTPGSDGSGPLLVCVGPSPFSAHLLRATRRMAAQLHTGWIALHVQTPQHSALGEADRERVGQHLRLAERLGAEVHTVAGDDLAAGIVEAARRHGVSRIVVGKPVAPRWRDLLGGSLVFDLVRRSGSIDIYVINGEGARDEARARSVPGAMDVRGTAIALAAVAMVTALGWPVRGQLAPANLAMLYLLVVVAVAFRGRRMPVVIAALVGVLTFDFCFVPPYLTFTVTDSQYLITFAGMLIVGLAISSLSARLRAQADGALRQAATAQALHRVSRDLASTRGLSALVEAATARCREVLGIPVVILVTDRHGSPSLAAAATELVHGDHPELPPAELAVARWVVEHNQPAGAGTDTLPGSRGLHLPLGGTSGPVGVLCCLGGGIDDPERMRLLESLAAVVGLAIDCERLATAAHDARVAVDAERLRNALLSSVSHDLRTPLAAIAGSASTLLSGGTMDAGRQRDLLATIADEAARLTRLVGNLLEVTRLEGGAVRLRTAPVAVEDLVGSARAVLRERLSGRAVAVDIPVDCPPVNADEVLVQSALVNLLDNAVKYTPSGSPIGIRAVHSDGIVTIAVSDRGPGLGADETERVFGKFYRGVGHPGVQGAGLGLAIVKGVVAIHGGAVTARNREGGGAEFAFTLPSGTMGGDG